ncbi:hypothetical protein POM88_048051 [Heracleum sosnowskyi]|uniref:DUF4218 domain-containing protein n=1 Tax=Heracleum sosnowskyi TaxID=360622 RepID=A0AAD8LY35_9APIA|nr:hypothetical protein POM88_048051 [Heracleum sosnowskyi]
MDDEEITWTELPKSKPEGSIAEGYLAEECLTFCSRFLNNDAVPKFERCPQKDAENLIEEHRALIDSHPISKKYKRDYETETLVCDHSSTTTTKKSKKPTEVYSPRKSARLNNAQGIIPNEVKSSKKPALLKNPRQGRGENVEVTSARKSTQLVSARPEISVDAALKQKPKYLHNPKDEDKGKSKVQDKDECVQENEEQSDDGASEILPKKTKKVKNKLLIGPTTRSRANGVTTTENGSTHDDTNEEATNSVLVEHPAKTQLPCIQGIGSMADYLAMRELRQKKLQKLLQLEVELKLTRRGLKKILEVVEVVEEVEAKLNQKVNEEVDVKVNQKVHDNLTLVL